MMFLAERLRYKNHDICLVLDFVPPEDTSYTFDGHILFTGTKKQCENFISANKLRIKD